MPINRSYAQPDNEQAVGVKDTASIFDLDLTNDEILQMVDEDARRSEQFWKSFLAVSGDDRADNVRELGEKVYKGVFYPKALYDHQVKYVDNRITVDIDTMVPRVTGKIPEPVATAPKNTAESKKLARDVQIILKDGYVRWGVKRAVSQAFFHQMLAKRIGVVKGRFDPDCNEIVFEVVRPEALTVDHHARPGKNPRFVVEYLEATVEELVEKFPDAKDAIYRELGFIRGTAKQLTRLVGYREVWFTYRDKKTKKIREGTVHLLNRTVLGKMKDPNWLDEPEPEPAAPFPEEAETRRNHIRDPRKPYFFLNFDDLNFGRHFLDDTSLLEQALPLQDVVNKRGRQYVENADDIKGGMVANGQLVPAEAVGELTGDPAEWLVVQGDVRAAAARLPPPLLPQWAFEHMQFCLNEIDNVFGINAPLRGEPTKGSQTLGQEILQTQRNIERLENMGGAVERFVREIYDFALQLIKVHYTEEHFVRILGPGGKTDFLQFSGDKIEDGIEVNVQPGSLLPTDKLTQRSEAMELVKAGLLDPLTLYERMELPNPEETYRRWLTFKTAPQQLLELEKSRSDEAEAIVASFQRGEEPDVPEVVNDALGDKLLQFMETPDFEQLDTEKKTRFALFARKLQQRSVQSGSAAPGKDGAGSPAGMPSTFGTSVTVAPRPGGVR